MRPVKLPLQWHSGLPRFFSARSAQVLLRLKVADCGMDRGKSSTAPHPHRAEESAAGGAWELHTRGKPRYCHISTDLHGNVTSWNTGARHLLAGPL